jgi:CheY-like chemotaxis protein
MAERSSGAKSGNIFRILIVDDDAAAAPLLREVMKDLRRPHELYFVWDGREALDFLHGRMPHQDAPRPNLILLDINMPRLGGFETLAAIKSDPELRVIPVIMLSTSHSTDDVRRSYQAHANCYVRKPTDLEGSVKLVQAIEAFWMNAALLVECDASQPAKTDAGPSIALESAEARSQAMRLRDLPLGTAAPSRRFGCEEHNRLLDEFGTAVRQVIELHEQQFLAIMEDDSECHRFDLLIHMANEKKQRSKYAYLRHAEEHGCSKFDAVNNSRT